MNDPKKKVLVAMSGGVDSSVAALLLKKKGYDVSGLYLKFWSDPLIKGDEKELLFPENKCCSSRSLERARRVAQKLDMPLYVKDISDFFKAKIVDYFLEDYKIAKTPNPCIECNRNIKFGYLLKKAMEFGSEYLATGHYARIKKKDGKYQLLAAKDKEKDQSYFLYTLTQEKLRHILFPIGDLSKDEVRDMARKNGLDIVQNERESQDICFFPDKKHTDFLKRHLKKEHFKKGPIQNKEGKLLGEHEGLPLYTIGQRKGLNLGGENEPWYVIELDHKKNTLKVGKHKDLFKDELQAGTMNFIVEKPRTEVTVYARIRHRSGLEEATLKMQGEKARLHFKKPQRGISKGQSVVFYLHSNEEKCPEVLMGGGIIE